MKLAFTPQAWLDYQFWIENDRSKLRRINDLIEDARRGPFVGIGKPEPSKGELRGWWSRRVDGEHRLVHRVTGANEDRTLVIAACRFHYAR